MQVGADEVVAVVVHWSWHDAVHPASHSVDAVCVHDVSHSLYSCVTHACSTVTVMHSVMHSSFGWYWQLESALRKMPPHASRSARAVDGGIAARPASAKALQTS